MLTKPNQTAARPEGGNRDVFMSAQEETHKRRFALTRSGLVAALRVVPSIVAIYSSYHSLHQAWVRYDGDPLAFAAVAGGVIVMEVWLAVGFELFHLNMVHGGQRVVTLAALVMASLFASAVVLVENGGVPAIVGHVLYHTVLPLAPIVALWVTIAFFGVDMDAKRKNLQAVSKSLRMTLEARAEKAELKAFQADFKAAMETPLPEDVRREMDDLTLNKRLSIRRRFSGSLVLDDVEPEPTGKTLGKLKSRKS